MTGPLKINWCGEGNTFPKAVYSKKIGGEYLVVLDSGFGLSSKSLRKDTIR